MILVVALGTALAITGTIASASPAPSPRPRIPEEDANEPALDVLPAWARLPEQDGPTLYPDSPPDSTMIASSDQSQPLSTLAPADAGYVIEVFTNTWAYNTLGLVYDPTRDHLRYAHESQSSTSNPTIYDVDYPLPHPVLFTYALSAQNTGWPWELDNCTGASYDADMDTYLLSDYNGDLSNADDNIVEVDLYGNILNAWEMDDEVGSNDSADGSEIDSIIDIAVVPGTPTRYFATAAYDGAIVYEIGLTKTGTLWTPNSWTTVATYTNAISDTFTDNLGIDYDAQNEVLYHSGWHTTTILVTDLSMNAVTETPTFDCPGAGGYNSGVTFIEGSIPPEVWVTDFSSDQTTRCEAVGEDPTAITWDKWIEDTPWHSTISVTVETSDTLEVVDVITASRALQLMERWNPAHLWLLSFTTEPAIGQIVTGDHFLEWNLPPAPDVVTMTKQFYVKPSTWKTTLLSETIRSLGGDLEAECPVVIEKEPPALSLQSTHPPTATAGSVATYTLAYTNSGGYENNVAITSTFPITAPFLYAVPYPTHVGGNLAVWEIGDLPGGATDQIEVFVEIPPTLEPTQTVEIDNAILNHLNHTADTDTVTYNIEEPPDVEWMWDKEIDDVPWTPGITITVETSDTLQVVDVVSPNDSSLIETWDPEHLRLDNVEVTTGTTTTLPMGGLEWTLSPSDDMPATITKTFYVSPCTWIYTELWERFFVDGVPVDVRPVFIRKRPSNLWINSANEPKVDPGSQATFVLNYRNVGGRESGAWITSTFPAEATFVDATPSADGADPQGRWAQWNIGPLADGDGGTITVTVAITEGLMPSTTLPIYGYINDHADIEHDWAQVHYHVRPPLWEKRVDGVTWHPGISVTVETSDTFEVVDVIAGAFNTTLEEFWNPERLELLEFTRTAGNVITHENRLEWTVPHDADEVVTLTKRFRVEGKTWTHSLLHEELWVEGDFWRERPILLRKQPPDLQLTGSYEGDVFPGERVTFTLHYSNTGGYDSGVWVTSTFPISAPFVHAEPMPPLGDYDLQGRWAKWDVGALETGEGGVITVSAMISDVVGLYESVHIYNYIYDQVDTIYGKLDVERNWAPIGYTIQPVEPAWEKEIWINGEGPLSPGESLFTVVPSDTVTIVDRVWITAGAPVSFTLTEEWSESLDFVDQEHSAGSTIESGDNLRWLNWGEAANTWHVLTKTFQILGGEWETGYLTETLEVAQADPPTLAPAELEFDRGEYHIYLPLVMRNS